MTTYNLPPEPPVGTRLIDKKGRTWTRAKSCWEGDGHGFFATWPGLLKDYGPLTEVPAPALPAEDGALIIASGTGFEALFENLTLMRVGDYWCGLIPGAVRPATIVQDQITSWTEAVAVPKDKLDALREAYDRVLEGSTRDDLVDPVLALLAAEEAER